MRVQPHGFGVNCYACAEIQIFGQVVIVNMNGHDVLYSDCRQIYLIDSAATN